MVRLVRPWPDHFLISRDGTDTPIYVIHYKKPKISEQVSL